MNLNDALNPRSRASLAAIVDELEGHGMYQSEHFAINGSRVVDCETGETIVTIGRDGCGRTEPVMSWLDY